ncbi:hypothetical protein AAX29_01064 [Aliarcobacter thereius]|uniref:Uncharacterized protein n=1 Tax=Aliarcobacter thereius TaxID=544718 RepID=A0A1C0B6U3_9BACT|nr:hypothetical protein [Aliarcobacter thereius]OCL99252.1 hypothetical protein AAX29_01064 [Aliarcobacter thereius]
MNFDGFLAILANIVTIVGIVPIVYVAFLYVKKIKQENKTIDLSDNKNRSLNFYKLARNQALIDKVIVEKEKNNARTSTEVFIERFKNSNYVKREEIIKNGLRFILSDEAIDSLPIFDSQIYNKLEDVFFDFYDLVMRKKDINKSTLKSLDAWINLRGKQYSIKFFIPKEYYDKDLIDNIKFGTKTITSFETEVLCKYFLPSLIFYAAKDYESFLPEDTYVLLSSFWEVGIS